MQEINIFIDDFFFFFKYIPKSEKKNHFCLYYIVGIYLFLLFKSQR